MNYLMKMFNEFAEKHGTVFWGNIELALTESPYPDSDCFGDECFYASAMDAQGNLWWVKWYSREDADEFDDYSSQVEDWDKPDDAEIAEEGYYLD